MSEVNRKLPVASTCPYFNMDRVASDLKVDENGNADRSEILRTLHRNGIGADLAFLLDLLAAFTQMDDNVPEDKLNLTRILNQGMINHPADMHIVDQERGKVDQRRLTAALRLVQSASDHGIADQLCLAIVQQRSCRRDRRVNDPRLKSIFGRWRCNFLGLGEQALMLLTIGHRDRLTRVRILHVAEIHGFLAHGMKPRGWQRDVFHTHDVLAMVAIMALEKAILRLPLGGFEKILTRLLSGACAMFVAVYDRILSAIRFVVLGTTSAHLTTRAELRESYPNPWR